MIAWIKNNRGLAVVLILWILVVFKNAWDLKGLAVPGKESESWFCFWAVSFGLAFGVLTIVHMLYRAENLHSIMNKLVDRGRDEIRNLHELKKQIADELETTGQKIDHTMLGAFLYARNAMIADATTSSAVQFHDWDDREFDAIYIVKRKSTPVEEMLEAVQRTGKM